MTDEQREHLQRRLMEERTRALRALASFDEREKMTQQEADGDLTMFPFHPGDQGTDTEEQEKSFLLASKEGRQVYWIDEALQTLYKEPERYGRCEECGKEIVFERLDIVPWARLCIDCQRGREERPGRAA